MFLNENDEFCYPSDSLMELRRQTGLPYALLEDDLNFRDALVPAIEEALEMVKYVDTTVLTEAFITDADMSFDNWEAREYSAFNRFTEGSYHSLSGVFSDNVDSAHDKQKLEQYRRYIYSVVDNIKTEEDRQKALRAIDVQIKATENYVNLQTGRGKVFSTLEGFGSFIATIFKKILRDWGIGVGVSLVGLTLMPLMPVAAGILMTIFSIINFVRYLFDLFHISSEYTVRNKRLLELVSVLEDLKVYIKKMRLKG